MKVGVLISVACGSAVGGVLRYLVALVIRSTGGFPWATLTVNVVGSFLIGLLAGLIGRHWAGTATGELVRAFAVVGFCGGFTTFSTFSNEAFRLLSSSQLLLAATYAGVSVVAGLLAVGLGLLLVR